MDELSFDRSIAEAPPPAANAVRQFISGTYIGQRGSYRLILRLDLREPIPHGLYRPLNLVSGDFFRDVGGEWDYRYSFIVEHPYIKWGAEETVITGTMAFYRNLEAVTSGVDPFTRQVLRVTIPVLTPHEPAATATVQIIRWGTYKQTFLCDKTSSFLRTIDLEIDRIDGTELPKPFRTVSVRERPADLPDMVLDISGAYRRAGLDLRLLADTEVFASGAGEDAKWDEDELHHAMQYHFSQWKNEPQWKLYLLIATHFRLYPHSLVTGIMYDNQYRDAEDPYPRQGAAVFYSTMREVWSNLSPAQFDRNFLRTCVHELGHALNLLHSFDKDRPDSLSWMNYPWRYPYGYNLPPGWNGTQQFWQQCRFEFDAEELRHLRHDALMEVIPGGAAFGTLAHDIPAPPPASPTNLAQMPVALYVRIRPERYLFHFAEPIHIELKLKNQSSGPMIVPDMLNPEFGLLEIYIRDPRGAVRPYRPLFKVCGEPRMTELPPGEKLFESILVAYGADGFYFEEPGEYQIWAIYTAGGLRLRSNVLRIRVAYPQKPADEEIALYAFGREQGHVLYMRGAAHLTRANDMLREVTERFPNTSLAHYIHYCFGSSQARGFKDLIKGQTQPPQLEQAAQELRKASTLVTINRRKRSLLDNITHGRAVDLLYQVYRQMDEPEEAAPILAETARYFKRMAVKKEVVVKFESQAKALGMK